MKLCTFTNFHSLCDKPHLRSQIFRSLALPKETETPLGSELLPEDFQLLTTRHTAHKHIVSTETLTFFPGNESINTEVKIMFKEVEGKKELVVTCRTVSFRREQWLSITMPLQKKANRITTQDGETFY